MNQVSSLLTFRVGPFHFCVAAVEAEAIIEMPRIRFVPGAPPSVPGVISHRGKISVVVDLRSKFGLQPTGTGRSGQLIVARINEELKGFWVDEVLDLHQNGVLTKQVLPFFNKNEIFDHTLLIDKQIFFHTDFEKLFSAPDSEALGSFLSLLPSDSIQQEYSARDSAAESGGESITASAASHNQTASVAADTKCAVKPSSRISPPGDSKSFGPSKLKSPEPEGKVRPVQVQTGTSKNGESLIKLKRQGRTGSRLKDRAPLAAGCRLHSVRRPVGPADRHARLIRPSFARQPSSGIGRNQLNRQDKPGRQTGLPAAGLLFLLISCAATVWWWPDIRPGGPVDMIAEIHSGGIDKHGSAAAALISASHRPEKAQFQPAPPSLESAGTKAPSAAIGFGPAAAMMPPAKNEGAFAPILLPAGKQVATDRTDSVKASIPAETVKAETPPVESSSSEKSGNSPPEDAVESVGPQSASDSFQKEPAPENSVSDEPAVEEIFRIETDEFTIAVARPESPPKMEKVINADPISNNEKIIHMVVRGDTLWDIANNYLGDPFRYPELARLSHIKDPHWIYPGDIVTIVRKKCTELSSWFVEVIVAGDASAPHSTLPG